MLFRPRARLEGPDGQERQLPPEPNAPWALDDGVGTIEAIAPTPQLEAMMPGNEGLFYARRAAGGGWDIIGPVTEPAPDA